MTQSLRTTLYAAALGVGFLSAGGLAHAQTASQGTTNNNTITANPVPATDTGGHASPNGTLEKYHNMLRVSELTGATVFNDQGAEIGTVNDMLLGDDGKVQHAVLSVGGFLGVGTHYVSVPFGQLQVQPSRTNTVNGSSGGTDTAGSTATGPAAGTVSTRYYSVVLPGATKDALTKMPEFNYRS